MDRTIEVQVKGSYLTKDNKSAGVQYEGNAKVLRITFDKGWDENTKTVTFWNAKGENPVKRILTADLLEDMAASLRTYLVPVPPEAMTEAGKMSFVIDGWFDDGTSQVRQRSVSAEMEVKEAPFEPNAGESVDPTPTQAEQLQVQIDRLLATMQEIIGGDYLLQEDLEEVREVLEEGQKELAEAQEALKKVVDTKAPLTHAERHAADGDDPITPAMIGAVNKTGDTMTGDLAISKAVPTMRLEVEGTEGFGQVRKNANAAADFGTNILDAVDADDYSRIILSHASNRFALERVEAGGLAGSFAIYHEGNLPAKVADGTATLTVAEGNELEDLVQLHNGDKTYAMFGQHNKPRGTYTGNGDAVERTIDTGGMGNVCVVTCNDGSMALVTNVGMLYCSETTEPQFKGPSLAYFSNGVLHLKVTSYINVNDQTYVYQVV